MLSMSIPAQPDPVPQAYDAEVIARAARGEEEAWIELSRAYGRRIYALVRSRLRSDDLAEEITQSVFVTLAEKLRPDTLSGYEERGRFESWLFRIAMNRVRDHIRRAKRSPFVSSEASAAPAAGTDDSEFTSEDVVSLRAAIAALNEADREVIELRHHGGLSFQEIAETLGQPMGTVLARHHRALRKLKEHLSHTDEAGASEDRP